MERCILLHVVGISDKDGQLWEPWAKPWASHQADSHINFLPRVAPCGSTQTAYYRDFGQVRNPFTPDHAGQPSSLTNDNLLFLKEILKANPSLYLDERAKVGKTTILYKADPWLGSSSDQWVWAMESSVEVREEIKMRDEELKIIEWSTHHYILRNKPGAQTFSRRCWIKIILKIRWHSAQSLVLPQGPLQWWGHWTHLHRLLNWSQQERISWVTNGRHMLESSENAKSWRQGDGWHTRDKAGFKGLSMYHCIH